MTKLICKICNKEITDKKSLRFRLGLTRTKEVHKDCAEKSWGKYRGYFQFWKSLHLMLWSYGYSLKQLFIFFTALIASHIIHIILYVVGWPQSLIQNGPLYNYTYILSVLFVTSPLIGWGCFGFLVYGAYKKSRI